MAEKKTGCATKVVAVVLALLAFRMCSTAIKGDKRDGASVSAVPTTVSTFAITAPRPSASQPAPLGNFPKLEASALRQAYASNEIAADNDYKSKRFRISGTAKSVGKDITGDAQIFMLSDSSVVANNVDNSFAATVNPGDRVSVTCTVSGKMLGFVSLDCSGPQ